MANRFWVNGGNGNWNSTTNWSATSGGASGASVPTSADDAFFDANGNSNANAATTGISVRSITFASGYTSNFSVTFGGLAVTTYLEFSPNMTTSGNNTLSIKGGQLKTNGLVINVLFQFSSNGTIQLLDNCTATNLIINPITSMTLNGFAINATGTLTLSGANALIPTLGTTVLNINGTGNQTIVHNNGALGLTVNINKASGTLNITNLNLIAGVLNYVSGTVVHTGALVIVGSLSLNTSGVSWNNLQFGNSTTTNLTFLSTFTLTGDLNFTNTIISTVTLLGAGFFTSCSNINASNSNVLTVNLVNNLTTGSFVNTGGAGRTFNNNVININNNLTLTGAATVAGSAVLNMIGTGTWSGAAGVLSCNLVFNTSGTITVSGQVTIASQTTTYTAGTIVTTGSTLRLGTNCSLNTNGVIWNNITSYTSNPTYTLLSNLRANSFTTTVNTGIVFNGGIFYLNSMNVSQTVTSTITGTTQFVFDGTGTITGAFLSGSFNCPLIINTLGSITLSGTFRFNNTFTYTQGTVNPTTSTVLITGTINSNNTGLNFNILTFDGNITNTGTHGWTTNTLDCSTGTHTYKAGNIYNVTNLLQLIGLASNRIVMLSDSSGNQAFFNLLPGGTMTIGYVTATDINSSGGLTIWDWQGVLNNTVNWRELLPPSTVGYTFWN